MNLRDLLYLDLEKAASLVSQLEKGLLREVQAEREATRDERNVRKYDLPMFKPEFGGVATEKQSQIETRIIHHDVLDRLESALFMEGFAIDLNSVFPTEPEGSESIRERMRGYSCIRTEGWTSLEDYGRLADIASQFNELIAFISQCSAQTIRETDEYKSFEEIVRQQRESAESEKDKSKRAERLRQVKRVQQQLESLLAKSATLEGIPDWLVTGLRRFIEVLLAKKVVCRVYPFSSTPDFGIIANLRREAFVDSNIENILFAYGPRPNLKLTILGIITSIPELGEHPMQSIRDVQKMLADFEGEAKFEESFKGAFEGFEGMEKFVRFSRYPSITLYPLAVYQRLARNTTEQLPVLQP